VIDMKKKELNGIEILEEMLTSLVELLEEKKIITDKEWNERIKKKLIEKKRLTKFEDLK